MEKFREEEKNCIFHCFIEGVWQDIKGVGSANIDGLCNIYIKIKQDMYEWQVSNNQGLTLCPYLFTFVIDKITSIQDEVSWCILFANIVVIISQRRKRSKWQARTYGLVKKQQVKGRLEYMLCKIGGVRIKKMSYI